MQALLRRFNPPTHSFSSSLLIPQTLAGAASNLRCFSSSKSSRNGGGGDDDEWNTAWETAWLPEDNNSNNRAPWEADINIPTAPQDSSSGVVLDEETKAFVDDMNENWDHRKKKMEQKQGEESKSMYSVETIKRDYRVKKQRIHASLWMKEIEKQEEARLGDPAAPGDDIDRLLDSCSEYVFISIRGDGRMVMREAL